MNGIVDCDLCTEFCMMDTNDPFANKHSRTTTYLLADGTSPEYLKEMFCSLFLKNVEITIINGNKIKKVKKLKEVKNEGY